MTDPHDPAHRSDRDFDPEGIKVASARFVADVIRLFTTRTVWSNLVRLSHSFPNLGAEAAGKLGLPRKLGKALILFLLACAVVAVVVH